LTELQTLVNRLLQNVEEGAEHLQAYGDMVDDGFHAKMQKTILVLTFIFCGGQRPQVLYDMKLGVFFKL
jgi:hypothetical protein